MSIVKSVIRLVAAATLISSGTTLAQGCGMNATPMAFGQVEPGAVANSIATLSISCDSVVNYRVLMGPGLHSQQFAVRAMAPVGGADLLQYNLFLDASLSLVWGDGSGGTAVAPATAFLQCRGPPRVLQRAGVDWRPG